MPSAYEVARELFDAFDAHDVDRMTELYAEDARVLTPVGEFIGREAAVGFSAEWYRAFPDTRTPQIVNEIASDRQVCFEFTWTATHEDTFRLPDGTSFAATGRKVGGQAVQWVQVAEGHIAEEHLYFDVLGMFVQLGLLGELAATAA